MSNHIKTSLIKPYVKAINALKDSVQETLNKEMTQLCPIIESKEVSKAISHPAISHHDIAKALIELQPLSDVGQQLMFTLAKHKRLNLLPTLSHALNEIQLNQGGKAKAQITSAYPLTQKMHETINQKLQAKFGKSFESTVDVDESLIGGVVVQYGNNRMDASIKTALKKLYQSLCSHGGNL